MTLDHIVDFLPRMRIQDAHEVLAASRYLSLYAWARSRVTIPGCAFAATDDAGTVQACGGVIEGAVEHVGALWLVGSEQIGKVTKHVLRTWRAIRDAGGFRRIECKCFAENELANRFAQHLGFQFEGRLRGYTRWGEDVNQYGLLIGGQHGR